jgi:hypothetical protein
MFKNYQSQSNGPYNSPSIYVKTVPPDGGLCYNSASNPLAILGTSHNGLGDSWHIADVTLKKSQKSASCYISGNAPWHIVL